MGWGGWTVTPSQITINVSPQYHLKDTTKLTLVSPLDVVSDHAYYRCYLVHGAVLCVEKSLFLVNINTVQCSIVFFCAANSSCPDVCDLIVLDGSIIHN